MEMHSLTRRRLFAAAGAVLAASALQACSGRPDGPAATGTSTPVPDTALPAPEPPADPLAEFRTMQPTEWGTDMPGITTTVDTEPGVRTLALTFDACGGPLGSGVDTDLLGLLRGRGIQATLFLNSRWIDANPDLTRELAADPLFRIENHGTRHHPLSVTGREAYGIAGTADVDEAFDEIAVNQDIIEQITGERPRWFRSGTAHYDDVAVAVAASNGVGIAGYTTNLDAGATFTAAQVARELENAPDGAVCLGHMNQPTGGTAAGVRDGLDALGITDGSEGGPVRFVHLP